MHWAEQAAENLIKAHPDRQTFVCASGISPSGAVHIGNFREVVTTYFVVRALQKRGKKVRFIFSWDDFDRFRKVPKGVDPSFEQYIGRPYAAVPDPHGCCESYAAHYEKQFEASLATFGIEVEFLYQHQQYQSGRYREGIHRALIARGRIYDILMSFKTQEATDEERRTFYPVSLYCHTCGKDDTKIHAYDEGARVLYYECACGHHGQQAIRTADNIKLIWKVDWPMRWVEEDVVFEPGGRDHSSATGSYNVSSVIAREIFGFQAPSYVAYEFIGIKGSGGKMSSSVGNTITPDELMQVYAPEVILYIFSKYLPSAAFNIGMDEDVIKHDSEFERVYNRYRRGDLNDPALDTVMYLSTFASTPKTWVGFGQLAGLLPLVGYDLSICKRVLGQALEGANTSAVVQVASRVKHWITNWQPSRAITLNKGLNRAYYVTLPQALRTMLLGVSRSMSLEASGEEWLSAYYEAARCETKKETKVLQAQVFEAIYQLLISQNQGPRLPILIDLMGSDRVKKLIEGCERRSA